jgi:hypothetical protein
MFIIRPDDPIEAVFDVKAARAVGLRVSLERPDGRQTLLGSWREARDAEPIRVTIPPLDVGDRLRISLGSAGEDEEDDDDLVDVNVAFMQGGRLLRGSERILRERVSASSGLVLDYHRRGGGVEMMAVRGAGRSSWAESAPPSSPSLSPSPDFRQPGRSRPAGTGLGFGPAPAPPMDRGEPAAAPAPAAGEMPPSERRINVWMQERESDRAQPLAPGERYTLCVNVGLPVAASLAGGPEAVIPEDDIPPAGLATDWVIQSSTAELQALSPDVQVTRHDAGGTPAWTARFALHVPRGVDSETVRLACIPRAGRDVRLQTLVYARNPGRPGRAELYRELDVALHVVAPALLGAVHKAGVRDDAVRVKDEVTHSPVAHLNLRTSHEWTSPMNVLSVTVLGPGSALANGDLDVLDITSKITPWNVAPAKVTGLIKNLREALEAFRAVHEAYLDAVDPADLDRRLDGMNAGDDFFGNGEPPSAQARAAWEAVSTSEELYTLALEGRTLYDAFFPTGSQLRGWIDAMQPHDRLDVALHELAGAAYVPHVPWGLMYRLDPPEPGEPVDPLGFLGLCLRIGYSGHDVSVPSKALGRLEDVHRAFLLYWGDQPRDPTAIEARWQRDRWAAVPNHVVVPGDADGGQPKKRLMSLLRDSGAEPIRLLYLYCQCKAEQGNDPELRFANNTQPDNVVRRLDLGIKDLAEQPLVFANACTTSAADPFMSNELEAGFFRRKARAYLGTESKVPISLASRFATVFFHYFDRKASPAPMAAGEAAYQARQFLWRHYRNLGGLFYTYVNQYELYMADDAEVRTLQP